MKKNHVHFLIRVLVAVAVLAATWRMAVGFGDVRAEMVSFGFPRPNVPLLISLGAGFLGGLALLIGLNVRAAILLVAAMLLPPLAMLDALYSGNTYGNLQGMVQLLRVLEVPALLAGFLWLLSEGPGPWSVSLLRRRDCEDAAIPGLEC